MAELYKNPSYNISKTTALIFAVAETLIKYTNLELTYKVASEHGVLFAAFQLKLGYVFLRDSCMMVTSLQIPLVISASNSVGSIPSHNKDYTLTLSFVLSVIQVKLQCLNTQQVHSVEPLKWVVIIQLNIYIKETQNCLLEHFPG